MMRYWIIFAVAWSVVMAGLVNAQTPAKLGADATNAVNGNNGFACDLYAQLAKEEGNLFFSPYSISNALAMTYAGARGQTAEQMAKTLRFGLPQERLHPALKELVQRITGEGKPRGYQLVTANRLWGQKGFNFLPEFLQTTETNYGAGLKEVDFVNATEEARQTINGWVEEQTKDKIKELLKPGILDVDTCLVLTNAIYFKAAWLSPFDPKATRDGDFSLASGKKIQVPMMQGKTLARYFADESLEMLELPYRGSELSMLLFLPKKIDGLGELEKGLSSTALEQWQGKLSLYLVDVTLPKFKMTAEFRLNNVLMEMGMPDAFDLRKADFSGMTTQDRLYITHVIHKAFVDVNEAGTEAAAATAVVMGRKSKSQPATFRADRPFVFAIRDNLTGSVLFMGRVASPKA